MKILLIISLLITSPVVLSDSKKVYNSDHIKKSSLKFTKKRTKYHLWT